MSILTLDINKPLTFFFFFFLVSLIVVIQRNRGNLKLNSGGACIIVMYMIFTLGNKAKNKYQRELKWNHWKIPQVLRISLQFPYYYMSDLEQFGYFTTPRAYFES